MFIYISKSDVLQSIGFALTSANEELDRVKTAVTSGILMSLIEKHTASPEAQENASRALTDAQEHVAKLDTLRRMAEYANESEILLDAESFALIECNLPAR